MFKKLLIASAILAVSANVFAANYKGDYKGEAAAPCPTYNLPLAPYIGLSVGKVTNISGTPAAYDGINGILSLGYGGIVYPNFYLAGELFAEDNAEINDYRYATTPTANPTMVGVKSSWGYGFDLIPGYMITDHVMAYLRGGVIRSRFDDQSANATGWRAGIGGQTNVWMNWDLRAEYVYNGYNSVSGIGKPQSDQFNLGVVYRFV